MPQTRIGISGWRYKPWRGTFYPQGLAQKRELEHASRQVNSIEINGSFYSLQRPKNYQEWYDQTPADFVFAVKGGRYITHMRKLKDVRRPLANFFASGVLALKEKLGPFLWQFPPGFAFNAERFDEFFDMLPRDMEGAAEIAGEREAFLKSRSHTKIDKNRRLRHAVEIRHESFKDAAFIKLLRKHKIALVFADTAGKWPYMEDVTADFIYARLHGDKELYVSGYTDEALAWWAERLKLWQAGKEPPDANRIGGAAGRRASRDVYVYFDNDVKVRAPYDAMQLMRMMRGEKPLKLPELEGTEEARRSWPAVKKQGR